MEKNTNSFENPNVDDFAGMMPKGVKFTNMMKEARQKAEEEVQKREKRKVENQQYRDEKDRKQTMDDGSTFKKESMSRSAGIKKVGAGGRTPIGKN